MLGRSKSGVRLAFSLTAVVFISSVPAHAANPNEIAEDGTVYAAAPSGPFVTKTVVDGLRSGLPDIALVASAAVNVTDPWFTDPHDDLVASGSFNSVTIIHAGETTPSLAELEAFDAVILWSNFSFDDAAALGDALAEFVDGGGGVVIASFANSSETAGRALGGKWLTHEYEVIPSGSGTAIGAATLGTVHDPAHPIMQNVATFSGGDNSYRPTSTGLLAAGEKIAEWDDGSTLVAIRNDAVGSLVDLGFYPPSDDVLDGFWDATTDGAKLIENALLFAATRVPMAPGDSDYDQDVDLDDYNNLDGCFTGEESPHVNANCVTFDFDRDGDVDCDDIVAFEGVWTEPGMPPVFAPCDLDAPLVPPAPHNVDKNRYFSFDPNNGPKSVAFRVTLPDGRDAWVDAPQSIDWGGIDPAAVSLLVDAPVVRVWEEAVIHVTGCAVVPDEVYSIRASDGDLGLSDPFDVGTVPAPQTGSWADIVGGFDNGTQTWSAPNGFVNFNDVDAVVKKFQTLTTAPHVTIVDLHPQWPNYFVNFADIDFVIKGFQDVLYPVPVDDCQTVANCPLGGEASCLP